MEGEIVVRFLMLDKMTDVLANGYLNSKISKHGSGIGNYGTYKNRLFYLFKVLPKSLVLKILRQFRFCR